MRLLLLTLLAATGLAAQTHMSWSIGAGPLADRPKTCDPPNLYVATDATPGQNLQTCYGKDKWAVIAYVAELGGAIRVTCQGGDPCTIGTSPQVLPSLNGPANVFTNANNFSEASVTAMIRLADADPPECDDTIKEQYFNTTTNTVRYCRERNVWATVAPHLSNAIIYTLPPSTALVATTNPAPKPNVVTVVKFVLPHGMTLGRLQYWLHTNGKPGSTLGVGVYDEKRKRVAHTGAMPATGAANRFGQDVDAPLAGGVYYWAWSASDDAVRMAGYNGSGTFSAVYNPMAGGSNDALFWGTAEKPYDPVNGLPEELGNLTAGSGALNTPLIVGFGGN